MRSYACMQVMAKYADDIRRRNVTPWRMEESGGLRWRMHAYTIEMLPKSLAGICCNVAVTTASK